MNWRRRRCFLWSLQQLLREKLEKPKEFIQGQQKINRMMELRKEKKGKERKEKERKKERNLQALSFFFSFFSLKISNRTKNKLDTRTLPSPLINDVGRNLLFSFLLQVWSWNFRCRFHALHFHFTGLVRNLSLGSMKNLFSGGLASFCASSAVCLIGWLVAMFGCLEKTKMKTYIQLNTMTTAKTITEMNKRKDRMKKTLQPSDDQM